MAKQSSTPDADSWDALTWNQIVRHYGEKTATRGRSYFKSGHVEELARSEAGELLAWVQGTEPYATTVRQTSDEEARTVPQSVCTCPVGFGCKHAVAVVLAYQDAKAKGRPVETATDDDARWPLLEREGYGVEEEGRGKKKAESPAATRRTRRREQLRVALESLSTQQLVDKLLGYADRFDDIGRELLREQALQVGGDAELVKQARKELRQRTAEEAWRNHWDNEGHIPDYSDLEKMLKELLARGRADDLLDLGEELLERGTQQIGSSNDEGETAGEIIRCMEVVLRAVPAASRPNPEKILWVIRRCLVDEYDLIQQTDDALEGPYTPEDWSAVANTLLAELPKQPSSSGQDRWSRDYKRDRLTCWIAEALDHAGREDEVLALYEAEAPVTRSYQRLVDALLAAGRTEDAIHWALEGITHTQGDLPGIADQLKHRLAEVAAKKKDWPTLAAFRARDFFEHPSAHSFRELLAAAQKAGCEEPVRRAALRYLETGQKPAALQAPPKPPAAKKGRGGKAAPQKVLAAPTAQPDEWPLPLLPLPPESKERWAGYQPSWPALGTLIDIAIEEKDPDEALKWFDRRKKPDRSRGEWGDYEANSRAEKVAEAVADSHPERALEYYQGVVDSLVDQLGTGAYEEAARRLRKERKLLTKLGRADEWPARLAAIRTKYPRKRKLLEILTKLEKEKAR